MQGFDDAQRTALFGMHAVNGNDDVALARTLGIEAAALPAPEMTSLVPVYERISDADMREYLSREMSFYLSQGCGYHCSFCAADRTEKDPFSGQIIRKVQERYRAPDVLECDLAYLFERAEKLGIQQLSLYLSNLDVFQTPEKLEEFAKIVQTVRASHPAVGLRMRGLACVSSFTRLNHFHKKRKGRVIRAICDAGLVSIGFGIDGGNPEVWESVQKPQNVSIKECESAIRIAREEYGITPEVLMVFGHPAENERSLRDAVAFTLRLVEQYGAVPRPHMAKNLVPGNQNWKDPANQDRMQMFLKHPEAFQALDFTTLPCALTHPDQALRALAAHYYRMIADIHAGEGGVNTLVTYPEWSPEIDAELQNFHRCLNVGQFDR